MAVSRAEVVAKIASSTISSGGNNLRDGTGRAALRKFELAQGFKGTRVVFEFVVVSSKKKTGEVYRTGEKAGQKVDVEPNPVGSDFSVVCMVEKHASAWGNAKAVILALAGVNDASNEDLMKTINGMIDSGDGIGRVVDFDTYRHVTEKGKEIVLPKWFSVEQTDESVEAMKKWFGQLGAATTEATA